MERIDLTLTPALSRSLVRASLEPTDQGWTLVLVPPAGPVRKIPMGPDQCHATQTAVAGRILRGDHPSLFQPSA